MVLLDALRHNRPVGGTDPWQGHIPGEIIVAHFDHGIRSDSASDAVFVRELASRYGYAFYSKREELGVEASEEKARLHRYAFLHEVCREQGAVLATAHHANDVAETIAINIHRGTGWRGVAVMDNERIWRPLLTAVKSEILAYAKQHGLEWRDDSTNASDKYLRNRLRARFNDEDVVWQALALRARQVELKHAINQELHTFVGKAPYSRYFLTHCGDAVALEILREIFVQEVGLTVTRPVLMRALHAVKVARAGSAAHVSQGITLQFKRAHFIVETDDKVLS